MYLIEHPRYKKDEIIKIWKKAYYDEGVWRSKYFRDIYLSLYSLSEDATEKEIIPLVGYIYSIPIFCKECNKEIKKGVGFEIEGVNGDFYEKEYFYLCEECVQKVVSLLN